MSTDFRQYLYHQLCTSNLYFPLCVVFLLLQSYRIQLRRMNNKSVNIYILIQNDFGNAQKIAEETQ